MIISYEIKKEDEQSPFMQCDKPFDCLIDNFVELGATINNKLTGDGYLQHH
ncbi:MAG: hypothetical protein ACR2FN_04160 [Chitinophagaceae bacterium]